MQMSAFVISTLFGNNLTQLVSVRLFSGFLSDSFLEQYVFQVTLDIFRVIFDIGSLPVCYHFVIANICNMPVNQTWLLVNQMIRNVIALSCQSYLPLKCRNSTCKTLASALLHMAFATIFALGNSLGNVSHDCLGK